MSQTVQSEKLQQLLNALSNAVKDLEKGENTAFYKALVQKLCIEIYELTTIFESSNASKTDIKPLVKIIKQEEILVQPVVETPAVEIKSEPVVIKKEPVVVTPEPVIVQEPIIEKVAPTTPSIEEVKLAPPVVETPKAVEPAKTEKEKPVKTINIKPSVNEKLSNGDDDDELSLNEKLSLNKQPVINIAEKSKDNPIADLTKAISISKKFEFIKGLFNGDGEKYKSTITYLQNATSREDALEHIRSTVKPNYDWSDNEELENELYTLIKRRFS